MLPIRDDLRPRSPAYVTWALLGLNAAVFLFQLGLPEWALERLYLLWGIVPARLTDPEWAWWHGFPGNGMLTLLTSMFLHGGWFHFLANAWTLWLFGDDVEDRLGHLPFLALYLGTGVAAGLTHVWLFPDSTLPTIGASGAISGVMGAFLVLFPAARLHVLVPIFVFVDLWTIPAALYLPVWFIGQLFSGTLALAAPGFGGVAFWAHIGGFVAGLSWAHWWLTAGETGPREAEYIPPRPAPAVVRRPRYVILNRW